MEVELRRTCGEKEMKREEKGPRRGWMVNILTKRGNRDGAEEKLGRGGDDLLLTGSCVPFSDKGTRFFLTESEGSSDRVSGESKGEQIKRRLQAGTQRLGGDRVNAQLVGESRGSLKEGRRLEAIRLLGGGGGRRWCPEGYHG